MDEEDQVQKQQEEEVRADMENKAAEEKAKRKRLQKLDMIKDMNMDLKVMSLINKCMNQQ